jgi:ATP synthase protein I
LKEKKTVSEGIREAAPYLGLGTQLAMTVTLLAFIGIFLDDKFDTKPVFIFVCTFFGAFAGLYNFIKSISHLDERKNDKK